MTGALYVDGARRLLLADPGNFYDSVASCRLVLSVGGNIVTLEPFDEAKGNWYELVGSFGFGYFCAFDTTSYLGAEMVRVDFYDVNGNLLFFMGCGGKVVEESVTVVNCLFRFPYSA